MSAIFDERGVIIEGFDTVRNNMIEDLKTKLTPRLNGKELRTDNQSVFGALISMVAKPVVENSEIAPLILSSFNIDSATGEMLDNLLWNLYRLKRNSYSQTSGLLLCNLNTGLTIPEGSQVSNNITGALYEIDSDVFGDTSGITGVTIEIKNSVDNYTLKYSVDGFLSQSTPITLKPSTTDIKDLADQFISLINSQSSYLEAKRNNDNTISVSMISKAQTGSFTVSDNMSIISVLSPCYAKSITYDTSESNINTITNIKTSVYGWNSVTNPFYIAPSQPVESDESYRERGKLYAKTSVSKYNSILLAIKSVRGVTYERVQINTSNNESKSGIVNNGVAITVMGGDESDIALAIFNSIGAGVYTVGNIEKQVSDINGVGHVIRFSRPTSVAIEISMNITAKTGFPLNGYNLIKQAIVEWFNELEVGESVDYSRLYEPINNVKGFSVKNLKVGLSGRTLTTDDVYMNYNEIATISPDNIFIGGR